MQGKWCMEQLFQLGHFPHSGQFLEDTMHIFTQILVCG